MEPANKVSSLGILVTSKELNLGGHPMIWRDPQVFETSIFWVSAPLFVKSFSVQSLPSQAPPNDMHTEQGEAPSSRLFIPGIPL